MKFDVKNFINIIFETLSRYDYSIIEMVRNKIFERKSILN